MKVLTEGGSWKIVKTCKGCKSVLEAETSDVVYLVTEQDIVTQQYELEIEGSYFIGCPNCGLDIKLKSTEIPQLIRNTIRGDV